MLCFTHLAQWLQAGSITFCMLNFAGNSPHGHIRATCKTSSIISLHAKQPKQTPVTDSIDLAAPTRCVGHVEAELRSHSTGRTDDETPPTTNRPNQSGIQQISCTALSITHATPTIRKSPRCDNKWSTPAP